MARWATVEEASEYVRMHKQTLHALIQKREGIGSLFIRAPRLLVNLDSVDELLNKKEWQSMCRNQVQRRLAEAIRNACEAYEDSPCDLWERILEDTYGVSKYLLECADTVNYFYGDNNVQ